MTKINNYIRYLLTLILLGSINVYAQTTEDLNQLLSQAGKELPTLSPSSSSPIDPASFSEIIKQNINIFGHVFLDYALPFLFVFGVLTYLAWESRKEINRPLLLIFFIITIITTIYFHSILKIIALGFGFILLIIGIYKIFHGIAKSVLALIFGIVILIVLLTNNIELLLSTAFFIFLFILFIIMFIYSVEVKNKISHSNEIKKLIYSIRKPEDIKKFKNDIDQKVKDFETHSRNMVNRFESSINSLKQYLNRHGKKKAEKIIDWLRDIENNVEGFRGYYKGIKMEIKNDETLIEKHYDEPIKSELLKILREGEMKIDNEAKKALKEYFNKYYHELQPMKSLIVSIVMRMKGTNKRKRIKRRLIENIYANIENTINNLGHI